MISAPSTARLPGWIPSRQRLFQGLGYAWFALLLFVILLVINLLLDPRRFGSSSIGTTLGLTAPLILAAIASAPPILAGGGGIDLSVGPSMGLVNALIVNQMIGQWHMHGPVPVIAFALAIGLVLGAVNGLLIAVLRLQPIVATLGTFLVYGGLTLWLVPTPSGSVPTWIANLAGPTSVVPIAVVLLAWFGLTRLPYYEQMMATGGDDRAAYASGVNVRGVRFGAYLLSGMLAAVAGLSLSALLGSVDPSVGPTYTLTAIAAAALGGVSLAGGRGGMAGATLGAVDIFLVQNILTYFNASSFTLEAAYGVILVVAVVLNSLTSRLSLRTRAAV